MLLEYTLNTFYVSNLLEPFRKGLVVFHYFCRVFKETNYAYERRENGGIRTVARCTG